MTELGTTRQLDAGIFVEISADGHGLVLTTEVDGRTTHRLVLSLTAAVALGEFVQSLRGVKSVEESVKRLR
jgi:hypothetical protein